MLRNLFTLICAFGLFSVAHAENKTEEFAAFYSFNTVALRPNLLEAMNFTCMKQKNDQAFCDKSVPGNVDAVIAYYTYRMTTEKSMDFFKKMVTCGKDQKALAECPEITSYIMQVHKDFNGVMASFKNLSQNKAGK